MSLALILYISMAQCEEQGLELTHSSLTEQGGLNIKTLRQNMNYQKDSLDYLLPDNAIQATFSKAELCLALWKLSFTHPVLYKSRASDICSN